MHPSYAHLPHIASHKELALYELIPFTVWIFDLDKHGWWWGNSAALKFWGLESLDQLVNKDLSGDTQGARDRTAQTFEIAAREGISIDPWTTYPQGVPKTVHMYHKAVLVGPEKHRAIIAFINEEVNLGETPENLLLVEAMRYTNVLVTSFNFTGDMIIENPAATDAYKHLYPIAKQGYNNAFSARFNDTYEGETILKEAVANKGGRYTCWMNTVEGPKNHALDLRLTRHPLTGEYLLLMVENDVTQLTEALNSAHEAQEKLRKLAHYDAVTGLPSLHYILNHASHFLARAERSEQSAAVMFLDLDGFKAINDEWGHDAGDQALHILGQRLADITREADQIARIGGDEFLALFDLPRGLEDAESAAQKIISAFGRPIELTSADGRSNNEVSVGVSIGIAIYPDHGQEIKALIKRADEAMYEVKRAGRNSYQFAKTQTTN